MLNHIPTTNIPAESWGFSSSTMTNKRPRSCCWKLWDWIQTAEPDGWNNCKKFQHGYSGAAFNKKKIDLKYNVLEPTCPERNANAVCLQAYQFSYCKDCIGKERVDYELKQIPVQMYSLIHLARESNNQNNFMVFCFTLEFRNMEITVLVRVNRLVPFEFIFD